MCGVFGVVNASGISDADRAHFTALGDLLRHRGPDGSGFIEEPRALLGMHRLSIRDVSHGWQPFWSEDGSIGVLGNGEIYNAEDLQRMLVGRGHILKTRSDIEIVPHLYEEFGPEFVHHLRGMFALVLLDKKTDQVLLIRDRLGEKPLSYVHSQGIFYFASEQTALIRSSIIPPVVNKDVAADFLLHGFCPEPHSIIEGISKVPAGTILTFDLESGTSSLQSYWKPLDFLGDDEYSTTALLGDMREAVTVSTVSDVPVGIALSGGLDSSLVAALAVEGGAHIEAFTVGYPDASFDESSQAREFAEYLGIPCDRVELGTREIAQGYASTCADRDEPIADIAGPSLAAIAALARSHDVPVLLSGLGGDELFWGYEWTNRLATWSHQYLLELDGEAKAPRFAPRPTNRQMLIDWIRNVGGTRSIRERLELLNADSPTFRPPLPFYQQQPGYRDVFHALKKLDASTPTDPFRMSERPNEVGSAYINALLETYLRVNGLAQLDRLSMRYSIESRVPIVDHVLIERVMASALRDEGYAQSPKQRLREATAEVLPREVLNRPKRGFTPPVREWLREIWRENPHLLEGVASSNAFDVSPATVQALMSSPTYLSGRVNQVAHRLLTLEAWLLYL